MPVAAITTHAATFTQLIHPPVVPPGYRFDATSSTTEKCDTSSFRSGWARPSEETARSCTPCGQGIAADSSQLALAVYDAVSGAISRYEHVAGSEEACCEWSHDDNESAAGCLCSSVPTAEP